MTERYNVYFAGRLVDGHNIASARQKLARAFNADQQTLDRLFSGKTQLVKSDCDQATALKYKAVMRRAGAEPTLSVIGSESKQANTAAQSSQTAAEKIAALAALAIAGRSKTTQTIIPVSVAQPEHTAGTRSIDLAPPGTDVLRISERAVPIIYSVDTSDLEMNILGQRLSNEPSSAPAMQDTSHFNIAAVGDVIPNLPLSRSPISPNIDDLTLSPVDFDFSDCVALVAKLVHQDLSVLSLTPCDDRTPRDGLDKPKA
jgi:hypothetical protein